LVEQQEQTIILSNPVSRTLAEQVGQTE